MIEFTIPQNLPVRAVVVTEPNAPPPDWLVNEIERWAKRQQKELPIPESPPVVVVDELAVAKEQMRTEVQQEIEKLRKQQSLFVTATEELQRATKLTQQQLNGLVREFQSATVELAHAISAKLVFEEIDQNRFPINNLVHEVLSRLEQTTDAVVRLHPDDLTYINQLPSIGKSDEEHPIRFVADSSLSRGECTAKAGEVSVIYSVHRQVEEIRRQLLSTVSGHAET